MLPRLPLSGVCATSMNLTAAVNRAPPRLATAYAPEVMTDAHFISCSCLSSQRLLSLPLLTSRIVLLPVSRYTCVLLFHLNLTCFFIYLTPCEASPKTRTLRVQPLNHAKLGA
jgi:hypothetical protein